MECDYLVVGSGPFGSVMAERLASHGDYVCVVEKRQSIGGNCSSKICSETGVIYHEYGTHIFHTNSEEVWNYLGAFTKWNNYIHHVYTEAFGKIYPLPITLETINLFYGTKWRPFEVEAFLKEEVAKSFSGGVPSNLEEKAISLIGRPLYECFIKGYTEKQWGKKATDLPSSIISRLPIRTNYDRTYFNNAKYQGIPLEGYTPLFEKMLSSPKIKLITNCDYLKHRNEFHVKKKIIYTGAIDALFDYKFGGLEWRSVLFEKKIEDVCDFQGTSVMNYSSPEIPYTRVHEPRHLHPEKKYGDKTILFYEYPCENSEEPYYPVASEKNREIYKRYKDFASLDDRYIIGGRLGLYAYLDMDQVISMALHCYKKEILGGEDGN